MSKVKDTLVEPIVANNPHRLADARYLFSAGGNLEPKSGICYVFGTDDGNGFF